MQRQTTPENSSNHASNTEYSTPARAKVKAVVKLNDADRIPYYKEDVFDILALTAPPHSVY